MVIQVQTNTSTCKVARLEKDASIPRNHPGKGPPGSHQPFSKLLAGWRGLSQMVTVAVREPERALLSFDLWWNHTGEEIGNTGWGATLLFLS